MAGQIRTMIDRIIKERGKGNATFEAATRTKLILKGFNPDKFSLQTPDDPRTLETLRAVARELGVVA